MHPPRATLRLPCHLWWFTAAFILFDMGPVANSAFYYVGYNENFGNYKATGLITRPSTARLRIGLAHAGKIKMMDAVEKSIDVGDGPRALETIVASDVYVDVDFDHYRVRITDEGGDVLPGGVDVATLASRSSYGGGTQMLRVGSTATSQTPVLVGNGRLLSNVRINDGGKISVAVQNLSGLPFSVINPNDQGLFFVEVETPAGNTIFALPPDEHRDFPIDMLTSDETFKFAAWAVNDKGESISPVTSLVVRPIDTKANIGSVTDYVNTGTPVTNAYVTEFTIIK